MPRLVHLIHVLAACAGLPGVSAFWGYGPFGWNGDTKPPPGMPPVPGAPQPGAPNQAPAAVQPIRPNPPAGVTPPAMSPSRAQPTPAQPAVPSAAATRAAEAAQNQAVVHHIQLGLASAVNEGRSRGIPEMRLEQAAQRVYNQRADVVLTANKVEARVLKARKEQAAREERPPTPLTPVAEQAIRNAALELVSSTMTLHAVSSPTVDPHAVPITQVAAVVSARTGQRTTPELQRLATQGEAGAGSPMPLFFVLGGLLLAAAVGTLTVSQVRAHLRRKLVAKWASSVEVSERGSDNGLGEPLARSSLRV